MKEFQAILFETSIQAPVLYISTWFSDKDKGTNLIKLQNKQTNFPVISILCFPFEEKGSLMPHILYVTAPKLR